MKVITTEDSCKKCEIKGEIAEDIRRRLILDHRYLVGRIALKLYRRFRAHVSIDDLYCSGIIGLIDAIEKYDISKKVSFEYYAGIRIKGAMLDEIRTMDWVPRALRQQYEYIKKVSIDMEKRLGRDAQYDEIAGELDMSLDDYHIWMAKTRSIYGETCDAGSPFLLSWEESSLIVQPDEILFNTYQNEIRELLYDVISGLSEKEQAVILLYYYKQFTMKEIGAAMGCSESNIWHIHTAAILKLRKRLSGRIDREDLPEDVIRDAVIRRHRRCT